MTIPTEEERILCVANAYEKKFFFNQTYERLPSSIKDELKIMCVLYTTEVGGILTLEFDEDGNLQFLVTCEESDLLFDEIGSVLKVKQLQREKQELLEGLEMYYRYQQGKGIEDVISD